MKFEYFLALKYIRSKNKEKFISFSSLISILGIVLGVSALIVVMGVMNGFDRELEEKIIGVNPNIIVRSSSGLFDANEGFLKKIDENSNVKYKYAILSTQCIVNSNNFSAGAMLNGVNFNKTIPVNKYIKGKPDDGITMGSELMKNLGVRIGSSIRIVLPFGKTTPFGFAPLSFKEKVTAVFKSGMYDYDASFVYMPIEQLWSRSSMKGKINTIAVNIKDPYKAEEVTKNIDRILPYGFYADNWIRLNGNFFTALKLEKIAMFIILLLVIMVAAFNIMSSLTMLVMEKIKDIAILVSFGATSKNIRNIFLKQSLIIGLIGVVLGDAAGIILGVLIKKFQFVKLPSDVYYINNIPVDLNPYYIAAVSIAALLLVVIASVYPAYKASKINVVEVLRQ